MHMTTGTARILEKRRSWRSAHLSLTVCIKVWIASKYTRLFISKLRIRKFCAVDILSKLQIPWEKQRIVDDCLGFSHIRKQSVGGSCWIDVDLQRNIIFKHLQAEVFSSRNREWLILATT